MTERWPSMMKRATAAEYCDMSEAAFEREIAAGRIPTGASFGGRTHWRKEAIDKALDRVSGEVTTDYLQEFRERRRGKAA